ncbi:MAG: DUF58 domain-containing protein [Chitinophagaceae bacterium]
MSAIPDPKILMSIRNLSLAAKTTVDGFLTGANKSAIKGTGIEFSQYRSYMPGDDLRWMDWKMFARSDRYYIRESEAETNISVRLLIDCSGSMAHQDSGLTKIDYARYIAACLAYLANRQGDAVGLYLLREKGIFSLTPRQGYQNLNRIFYQLEQAGPTGKFTNQVHYKEIYAGGRSKELLVFITDMYQEKKEIYDMLDLLGAMKHEIIVLHVIGRNELDLNFTGYDTLQDMETGATIQVDPSRLKKQYAAELQLQHETIKKELMGKNIYYRLLAMDEPVDEALRDFLQRRARGL